MALTEKQITARNFKAFYEGIRTYLNGECPTFANAFNKSDLYSTSEKIIGCWTDGKPLYQKTVDCGSMPDATSKNVRANISNIESVKSLEGICSRADGVTFPLPFMSTDGGSASIQITYIKSNDEIVIKSGIDRSAFSGFCIIQYTKTTDSAIKVGDGNDYSTDEQIVGTWIDGSVLYQKTIDCGALPNNDVKEVAHSILNLDFCVDISGFSYNNTLSSPVPFVHDTTIAQQIILSVNKTNVYIRTKTDKSDQSCFVTLRYTKSS